MTRRRAHRVRDDGFATVWAAAAVAVIMAALLLGLHLGAAVAARHRAEAAADLAALAAAGHAVHGTEAACRRAGVIAERMGGVVARCLLSEWDALVEVHVAVPLALPGTADAVGRARAGPAEPDPPATPVTTRSAHRHIQGPAGRRHHRQHAGLGPALAHRRRQPDLIRVDPQHAVAGYAKPARRYVARLGGPPPSARSATSIATACPIGTDTVGAGRHRHWSVPTVRPGS